MPEKVVQAQIVAFLRRLGGQVYVLGTRRPAGDYPGTRQTPGVPDLLVFLRERFFVVEVKAAGGRLSPEQQAFRAACAVAHVTHLTGGLDDVLQWLVAQGVVRADAISQGRRATWGTETASSEATT